MREALPPLPQYASMVWCSVKKSTGTNLPFTFTLKRIDLLRDLGVDGRILIKRILGK
jgi:hypothetical protein